MREPFAKRAQKQVIKISEIGAEKMVTQTRLPFQRPEFKSRYMQGNSQLLIIQSPGGPEIVFSMTIAYPWCRCINTNKTLAYIKCKPENL